MSRADGHGSRRGLALRSRRAGAIAGGARIAWTVATLVVVQTMVCGLAVLPVLALWGPLVVWTAGDPVAQVVAASFAVIPSYVLFALALMFGSAAATRVTGWRTRPGANLRLADLEWPLLDWVRYMVAIHIVRLFAGTLFRGTPIWSAYLRLNGARVGRRVYVNSLGVSDHNLLEFGDDVVIGGDVHLSGHTVEGGFVKTATVRLGDRVTIGLGSVIGIGVTVGSDVQIGALSLVPKHGDPRRGLHLRGGAGAAPRHRGRGTGCADTRLISSFNSLTPLAGTPCSTDSAWPRSRRNPAAPLSASPTAGGSGAPGPVDDTPITHRARSGRDLPGTVS